MTETADAIIIGAGVIGAALAFELSKRGLATLNIDKNPASGYGSTSSPSFRRSWFSDAWPLAGLTHFR